MIWSPAPAGMSAPKRCMQFMAAVYTQLDALVQLYSGFPTCAARQGISHFGRGLGGERRRGLQWWLKLGIRGEWNFFAWMQSGASWTLTIIHDLWFAWKSKGIRLPCTWSAGWWLRQVVVELGINPAGSPAVFRISTSTQLVKGHQGWDPLSLKFPMMPSLTFATLSHLHQNQPYLGLLNTLNSPSCGSKISVDMYFPSSSCFLQGC